MSNLTPLLLLAGVGLLKGSGLGVSRKLTSTATAFNTSGVSGPVQAAYARADNEGKSILEQLPTSLTGFPPDGVPRAPGATGSNIITDITSTASSIFSKGVLGFTSLLGQAGGYAATTFGFQGAIAQAQGMKFDDMGFTFANYNDVASGGVTNQFKVNTATGIGTEITRLGTLFDVGDLYNFATPGSICSNLINQGLGDVGNLSNKLEEQGVDLLGLKFDNQDIITEVMSSINGRDLEEIFGVTNFNPFNPGAIQTLADVLEITNVLGPDVTSEINSFDALSNKLGNIGGNFNGVGDISNLYSGLDLTSFPKLAALGTLLPDNLVGDLSSTLGEGSGPFRNPTVTDIIGSAAGTGYTNNIQNCINTQTDLISNNSNVRNLVDYLETNGSAMDNNMLAVLVANVNEDSGIQEVLDVGNDNMINAASQIASEKKNQLIAGCKFGTDMLDGSTSGVMSLTSQLPGMSLDPMSLGTGGMLYDMAGDDVYGEALQASIVESKNLSKFAVFGITPGQKMDPMAYSKQLSGLI